MYQSVVFLQNTQANDFLEKAFQNAHEGFNGLVMTSPQAAHQLRDGN